MATRQITGQLRDYHDLPLANVVVTFQHPEGAYKTSALYPQLTPVTVSTDSNGYLSSSFALVSGLNVRWTCSYLKESFTFNLPDGPAISISQLRAVNSSPQPAQTALDYEVALRTAADLDLQTQINGLVISGGGDKTYRHVQSLPAATWTVVHNLGKRVSVDIVDSLGDRVFGELHYDNNNQITLQFSAAFGGEAYCN